MTTASKWHLEDKSFSYDLFSKDDMGNDGVWKRIQVGWQVGVNVYLTNFLYAGVSYGTDFSQIIKDVKIHTTSVTLGYTF